MAKTEKLRQVLSTETPNDRGYVVLSGGLDWERYKKNPVLLLQHDWDDVIGSVANIRREGDEWVGELLFDGIGTKSKEAEEKYRAGSYRAVSISGDPYFVEQDGLKICTHFVVYEISLVSVPSNPDCVSNFSGDAPVLAVEFVANKEHKIVEFSAQHNDLLTKYKEKMEEEKKNHEELNAEKHDAADAEVQKEELNAETHETETAEAAEETKEALQAEPPKDASNEAFMEWFKKLIGFGAKKMDAEEKKAEEKKTELSAEEKEALAAKKTEQDPRIFDGEKALNEEKTKFSTNMKEKKTLLEFLADAEGKAKFSSGARFLARAQATGKFDEHAVEIEHLREFASIAQNDPGFVAFMGNVGFDINGSYAGNTKDALNRLTSFVSGINSMDFVSTSADLAKVQWLSLFYKQLFPEDTWVERCGRVSGDGVAGVIWINSAIAPKIYFGKRAPLNVAGRTYDDTPVGLAEYLFAMEPVIWQPATTDLLSYDAVGMGTSEAMRLITYKMHNYYLQQIAAAAPASSVVNMTGDTFASANMFPSNSAAAGNLKALTPADVLALQAVFINQNYTMSAFEGELILPAVFNMQIQSTDKLASLLYKDSGRLMPNGGQYAGFRYSARATTALFDTSSKKITDAELYLDGKVSDDGTIPQYTAPVLSATMYDAAIGFIPQDVVIALGRTNVHMVSDPSNYGWKMSMDIRTAAGAGRADGKGIGLIVPTA